jgi:hypothetical protein
MQKEKSERTGSSSHRTTAICCESEAIRTIILNRTTLTKQNFSLSNITCNERTSRRTEYSITNSRSASLINCCAGNTPVRDITVSSVVSTVSNLWSTNYKLSEIIVSSHGSCALQDTVQVDRTIISILSGISDECHVDPCIRRCSNSI